MKRFMLLLAFLISVGTSVWGQDDPVSSTSKTVDLSVTEGQGEIGTQGQTLAAALGDEANSITELKITGPLTEADFATMKNDMPMLQVLDMSGVTELPETETTWHDETNANVTYKGIPRGAFKSKLTLQKVTFPACMEVIDNEAFYGCGGLGEIQFAENSKLKHISREAFTNCSGLRKVDFSNSKDLLTIDYFTFSYCTNLKEVDFSDCSSLSLIGADVFIGCSSLQTIDLSSCTSLSTIGESAFSMCSSLTTVTLTNCSALKTIGSSAFNSTSNLSTFEFTALNVLENIGDDAFRYSGLRGEVVLGSSIKEIGSSAFYYCTKLSKISFEESSQLTAVSWNAFSGCRSLQSVDFSNCTTLSSISNDVFYGCCSLQSIMIDNNWFKSQDGVLFVSDMASLLVYPYAKEGSSYTIPSGVQTIFSGAFNLSTSTGDGTPYPTTPKLCELIIPTSVLSIQSNAFSGFYGKTVRILAESPIGLSNDIGLRGALVYVPKGSLAAYKEAAIWKDYTLIETGAEGTTVELTSAGTLASKLTGVDLGTIQDLKISGPMNASDFEVIKQMTLLTKVDLSGATMEGNMLPNYAFSGLSYLKEVKLPNSITEIGENAFRELSNLTIVNLPVSLERVQQQAFYKCSNIENLDFSSLSSLYYIGWNAFNGVNIVDLEGLSQTSIREISLGAFANCPIQGSLIFPATLTYIGERAFNVASITSIKLKSPEKVSLADASVFESVDKLSCEVYVPKGLGATYKADTYWSSFGSNIEEYGYLVTVTVNDDSGYATGGGAYEEGETVTLTASLYEYRNGLFAGWFENNQKLSGESTYSFTMGDTDRSIEARFSKDGYGIEGWSETVADPYKADGQTVMLWPYNSSLWVTGELDWNLKKFTYSRGASLLVESPITAEQINVQASMSGNQWYFISFPYDLKFSDIVLEQDHQFVVREYDGAARAANGMGASWRQLSTDATMKANKGYIIQFAQSSGFDSYNAASGMEALFNRQAVTIDLPAHTSTVPADANWNLVGNPFPCYFSVKQLFDDGLDGTVTVWSDQLQNYEYYTQDDADVYLAPLTAFFIQHSGSTSSVTFKPEGRVAALPTTRAALAELRSDMGREVINLQLANDSLSDKTRVVFNEAASTDYELGKDAAKFSSMNNNAPSLYSLDAQNQQLAINERPVGNGLVRLGCYIGVKGSYTLSAKEALASDLYLYDTETGASCNLRETSYAFTAEAGICNNRFELRTTLRGTGVEAIAGFSWQVAGDQLQLNGLPVGATVSLFDANGRMRFTGDATTAAAGIALPQSGIYYLIIRTAEGVSSTVSIKR